MRSQFSYVSQLISVFYPVRSLLLTLSSCLTCVSTWSEGLDKRVGLERVNLSLKIICPSESGSQLSSSNWKEILYLAGGRVLREKEEMLKEKKK